MNSVVTIADARLARDAARRGAAEKRREVQTWLGERYAQLLESADAIVDLGKAADDVEAFVAAVGEKTAFLAAEPDIVLPRPVDEEPSPGAFVARAAPLIWRALDNDDYGVAASLYSQCASKKLEKREKATLEPYAKQFKPEIARRAAEYAAKPPLGDSAKKRANAFVVVALFHNKQQNLVDFFFEKRWANIASSLDAVDAALTLRQTIVDAATYFLFHDLQKVAAEEIKGIDPDVLRVLKERVTFERSAVVKRAIEWTRKAARKVRQVAAASLREATKRAEADEFRNLVATLREACNQGPEWHAACSALFVEDIVSKERRKLGLDDDDAKTVRRDLFVDPTDDDDSDDALHARLLDDARKRREDNVDEDLVGERCSLWRAVFAPILVRLVDDRVCRGLDAARRDLGLLLDAVENAAALSKSRVRLVIEGNVDRWERKNGAPLVDVDAFEINWAAERCAAFFDARLTDLSEDAATIGALVLSEDNSFSESTRSVVSEYVGPRFAETLALCSADLRRRSTRLLKSGEEYRHQEDARLDRYVSAVDAANRKFRGDLDTAELRRQRCLARTAPEALTIEDDAAAKRARAATCMLLITARVAWSIYHSRTRAAAHIVHRVTLAAQSEHLTSEAAVLRDARAVVDMNQLRAAFDIADVDGDGFISPTECADAAAAICVGKVAPKAKRGPLRFANSDDEANLSLTFDEVTLLTTKALDAEGRAGATTALAAALKHAHVVALQGWASLVGGSLTAVLADDLAAFSSAWLRDDLLSKCLDLNKRGGDLDLSTSSSSGQEVALTEFDAAGISSTVGPNSSEVNLKRNLEQYERTATLQERLEEELPEVLGALRRTSRYDRHYRDWPRGQQLELLMAAAHWRDRSIDVEHDDGSAGIEVVKLPCRPTAMLTQFLASLEDQLSRAACMSDFMVVAKKEDDEDDDAPEDNIEGILHSRRSVGEVPCLDFEDLVFDGARRELWAAVMPGLIRAYEDALETASEIAPLSLAVDAYFLRYALRRVVQRETPRVPKKSFISSFLGSVEEVDENPLVTVAADGAHRVFRTVKAKIDPIDAELYAPFLKADAQRAYTRSSYTHLFPQPVKEEKPGLAARFFHKKDDVDDPDAHDDPFFDDVPPDDDDDDDVEAKTGPIPRVPLFPLPDHLPHDDDDDDPDEDPDEDLDDDDDDHNAVTESSLMTTIKSAGTLFR